MLVICNVFALMNFNLKLYPVLYCQDCQVQNFTLLINIIV